MLGPEWVRLRTVLGSPSMTTPALHHENIYHGSWPREAVAFSFHATLCKIWPISSEGQSPFHIQPCPLEPAVMGETNTSLLSGS